jgi:hypothetical protein
MMEANQETKGRRIDATPTWRDIVPLLLAGAENGSAAARAELYRMAELADAYVAADKAGLIPHESERGIRFTMAAE